MEAVEMRGSNVLILIVLLQDAQLRGCRTDGLLALNIDSLEVFPTADGKTMWIPFREIGTVDTDFSSSIFKVQYKPIGISVMEQWHVNCVLAFTARDGTNVLAFTQRMDVEAVLVRNPFLHDTAAGGGVI